MSESEQMQEQVITALDEAKAQDVRSLDVRGMTDITDFMIIASGTSDRHVKAVASRVRDDMLKFGHKPIGVEGEETAEWILIDFVDVVVHVMHPKTRDYYELEKLWSEDLRALIQARREGQSEVF